MPDAESAAGCTWIGEWADAFAACVRWSREHGHRHRIAWNAAQGGWRITRALPPAERIAVTDMPTPSGNHCPGCGWSSGGHDPRCLLPPGK